MPFSQRVAKTGFFSNPFLQKTGVTEGKLTLVDMGSNGDCFSAMAVGIMDNYLTTHCITSDLFNQLMVRHLTYFPQHRPTAVGLSTSIERMDQIIRQVNMAELVQSLACTLRQIAVITFVTDPAKYRAAFVSEPTPEMMSASSVRMNDIALEALANALSLNVEVKVTSPGKELHMRLHFNEDAENFKVNLQRQGEYYIPYVVNTNPFSTIKGKLLRPVQSAVNFEHDREIDVSVEDRRLWGEYQALKHRLEVMILAGEINKGDLLDIYTANLDPKLSRANYAGTEHGTSAFFASVEQAKNGVKTVIMPKVSHQEQVMGDLVAAIARNITLGHMSSAKVFAKIDDKKPPHSMRHTVDL